MGTPDLTGSQMDGGDNDLIRMQQMHGKAHTGDIDHGIQRTYLMKMDVFHRNPVGFGLRLCDAVVNGLRVRAYFLRYRQVIQYAPDIRGRGVAMRVAFVVMIVYVVMGMIMILCINVQLRVVMETTAGQIFGVLDLAPDVHNGMGAPNAAGIFFFHRDGNSLVQVIHDMQKSGLIRQEFIQGTHQHIAGGAHFTF